MQLSNNPGQIYPWIIDTPHSARYRCCSLTFFIRSDSPYVDKIQTTRKEFAMGDKGGKKDKDKSKKQTNQKNDQKAKKKKDKQAKRNV